MPTKATLSHIAFEATPSCNYRCLYCYNHWRREGEEEPRAATRAEAMRTLRRLYRQADFSLISFTGGEPSMAPFLGELVLSARLRRKQVNIISNGSADLERYRELARLGIAHFEIPLHSAESAVHDEMTAVPGSHAASERSIKELSAEGNSVVAVIVLTRLTISGTEGALARARELGARAAMLARFNPGGRGVAKMAELLPELAELKAAFKAADLFSRAKGYPVTANVCIPRCAIEPAEYPRIGISACGSRPEQRPITVDARGNVRMCNHSPVTMGNIHETPLREILTSPRAREWEGRPAFCDGCARWGDCRGGCRAASEQLGNGLAREDPLIEAYGIERIVL